MRFVHFFLGLVSNERRLEVWHSVDNGPATRRATLAYHPTSARRGVNRLESVEEVVLSPGTAGESALYRVSLRTRGENGITLNATVPLCLLETAKRRDQFTLHLDSNGNPWHLDYLVAATECKNADILGPLRNLIGPLSNRIPNFLDLKDAVTKFKSQVLISKPIEGARPKLQELVDTPDGKPIAEQSFFQKYWFYIIPILILVGMSSAAEEPAKGGGAKR
ncbi:hypothetical protein BDK51DRAFT_31163 [Blyttiomyces helicus]|uniref:ER membrane protein complex subunit 10 n=1 Tax=Blyttiomyces helicus TaxID=388810 RepID=A0A4P9WKK0_9FUNG|nr:hypothetical protein BDK51DRAFT_31163 [Blyttiomyces helicus]|eukprot:RKO91136.1 hypothetical protein BDK51DRAFT_31163 [Blyttiomyces helicus]